MLGINCYSCYTSTDENIEIQDTCNGFGSSTPTKLCPGNDYCTNFKWSSYFYADGSVSSLYFNVSTFDCDQKVPDIPYNFKALVVYIKCLLCFY